jgi:hypothetical protein
MPRRLTGFAPVVPDSLKCLTSDRLAERVRVWPVSVRRPSRDELRRGVAPLETMIRTVETALAHYDRTDAGKREARRRDLLELLSWSPPSV